VPLAVISPFRRPSPAAPSLADERPLRPSRSVSRPPASVAIRADPWSTPVGVSSPARRAVVLAALAVAFVVSPRAAAATATAPASAPAPVDFGRDILPILSNHCFHCHGPDDADRKGKLRLDTRLGALAPAKSGAVAVVPGQPAASELIQRLTSPHDDEVMPPRDAKSRPTAAQVELLTRWIAEGAPYAPHWAFVSPKAPAIPVLPAAPTSPLGSPSATPGSPLPTPGSAASPLPALKSEISNSASAGPSSHPVDAFVLARLARENLAPSPEADRRTLARRLSLDLTGLPPDVAAVDAFVRDTRPDAYERLVDALLASPHFGERWGRHWLDLARFADSAGYLNDTLRPYAYLYRDWVIDAVNRDVPFDRFTIEQLAGDLLPDATLEQKIATGFHRNSLKNDEAGADLELDRTKAAVDRTATTGSVWLGLTVGCAECHTHKYDPITHREFYQLYSFFNSTAEREVPAPRPDELADYRRKLAAWEKDRDRLEAPLRDHVATLVGAPTAAWEAALSRPAERWTVLAPEEITTITEDEERVGLPNPDRSFTTGERDPVRTRYVVKAPVAARGVTGLRLEALADLGIKAGRARSGDFHLAEFSAMLKTPDGTQHKLEFAAARADFESKGNPAAETLDGDNTTGWSITGKTDTSHVIVFELKAPRDFPAGSHLYVELEHRITGVLTRFRLATTTGALPLTPDPLPDDLVAILDLPADRRTPEQALAVARHVARFVDEPGKKLFAPLAAHYAKQPEFPKTAAPVLVAHERKTRIHLRGDYQQPGEEVEPGTPAVLPPLRPRGARADRLDLARWLVDPANPLTARVTVNHGWQHLFGRGLVATVDNFGLLGEPPSHPELLDWLALAFSSPSTVAASQPAPDLQPSTFNVQLGSGTGLGWSRKKLIRLLVTSATYRQSSVVRPDLQERDPLNVLLARQSRHRLEAEVVRDVFLAASGLLNRRIGGPSIHPPLPAFVLAFGRNKTWPETKGPEKYRRGMYIHLRRNVPYPMLATFDASDASVACLRRERSNSPLQALTLLNDPVFFECHEHLGRQLAELPGDTTVEARLRHAFELCLSRPPTAAELAAMQRHFDDQLALTQGDRKLAFVAAARLIMNLDEFITRE